MGASRARVPTSWARGRPMATTTWSPGPWTAPSSLAWRATRTTSRRCRGPREGVDRPDQGRGHAPVSLLGASLSLLTPRPHLHDDAYSCLIQPASDTMHDL